MTGHWAGSRRRQQLPPDWRSIVTTVRDRAGGHCEWPTGCDQPGTECDHWEHPNNHHPDALRWLCTEHHRQKTQREAAAAKVAIRAKATRTPARHPGLT